MPNHGSVRPFRKSNWAYFWLGIVFSCSLAGSSFGGITGVEVVPILPTTNDSIKIIVSGYFGDGCWSVSDNSMVQDEDVFRVNVWATDVWEPGNYCPLVIIPYQFHYNIGMLDASSYRVEVTEHHSSLRDPWPNWESISFSVLDALPDLAVGIIFISPSSPMVGERVTIQAIITNIGSAPAGGICLRHCLDGSWANDGCLFILLGPGESISFETSLSDLSTGYHYVSMCANTQNDCNTYNNCGEISFVVDSIPNVPDSPSASTVAPCSDSSYTITWGSVYGATYYNLYENGDTVYAGSDTSIAFSHSLGSYCYTVEACNDFGCSDQSGSRCVTIMQVPEPPIGPIYPRDTVCGAQPIAISWVAYSDATFYNLYLDGHFICSVTNTSYVFNAPGPGEYCFRVSACNNCGCSPLSITICIVVILPPSIPDTLYCNHDTVDAGESYMVSWDPVNGASSYELYENGIKLYEGGGTDTAVIHTEENNYYYTLAVCNVCGCSDTSNSLVVTVLGPTVVEGINSPSLPRESALSQNYPNPFNPETRIEFSLPRASHVTIEVYNTLGQKVRSLVSGRLSAGYKAVTWDSKDDRGVKVSSGIYLYRIVADDFIESKKMILLK